MARNIRDERETRITTSRYLGDQFAAAISPTVMIRFPKLIHLDGIVWHHDGGRRVFFQQCGADNTVSHQ